MRCVLLALMLAATGCIRPIAREAASGVLDALKAPAQGEDEGPGSADGDAEPDDGGDVQPATQLAAGDGTVGGDLARSLGLGVSRAVLNDLLAHKAEITAFVSDIAEQASKKSQGALLADLESGGPLSKAIDHGTAQAVRQAMALSAQELRAGLPSCPPTMSVRDCLHREAHALGQEMSEELRRPMQLFVGGLIVLVFLLILCALVLLVRLIRAPRGGAIARLPGSRWPHHGPRRLRPT